MSVRIFYPISSGDFTDTLNKNQRYRYFFGDKRRERKYHDLLEEMMQRQSIVINQLSDDASTMISYYRFMNNAHIELSELISRLCHIPSTLVQGKKLLVALDTCAATLHSRLADKESASPAIGVVEDNRTPGFYLHPSLVFNEVDHHIIGLGDMVLFNHPKQHHNAEENRRIRAERGKLPLEQKESFVWTLSAVNTHQQLTGADQITFLLDQEGDKYEALARIRRDTGADFIVRSNVDRTAMQLGTKGKGKISELLSGQAWMDENSIALRGLNHYSKTRGIKAVRRAVERKQRVARLRLRFISVKLDLPDRYPKYSPIMREALTVIEVCEHPASVPSGEEPIHWRLLTTRQVVDTQLAWHIVDCYQQRWLIEQLFRVLKKQGLKIEQSQLKDPHAVKRQAVMALKVACQVLQLTQAQDGKNFIPIESVFNPTEQQLLSKINKKLSGKTQNIFNTYADNSLAWAAWVIARLGGWKGNPSQRPPGPITMHRGLERFYSIIWANDFINDT